MFCSGLEFGNEFGAVPTPPTPLFRVCVPYSRFYAWCWISRPSPLRTLPPTKTNRRALGSQSHKQPPAPFDPAYNMWRGRACCVGITHTQRQHPVRPRDPTFRAPTLTHPGPSPPHNPHTPLFDPEFRTRHTLPTLHLHTAHTAQPSFSTHPPDPRPVHSASIHSVPRSRPTARTCKATSSCHTTHALDPISSHAYHMRGRAIDAAPNLIPAGAHQRPTAPGDGHAGVRVDLEALLQHRPTLLAHLDGSDPHRQA